MYQHARKSLTYLALLCASFLFALFASNSVKLNDGVRRGLRVIPKFAEGISSEVARYTLDPVALDKYLIKAAQHSPAEALVTPDHELTSTKRAHGLHGRHLNEVTTSITMVSNAALEAEVKKYNEKARYELMMNKAIQNDNEMF
mmetsp:Transcript_4754/g.6878  ORF Transcript_4754/g.6878 Transcript_4754/m.6878 type:complete len:144 (-) Transcript_4754:82-513(-)